MNWWRMLFNHWFCAGHQVWIHFNAQADGVVMPPDPERKHGVVVMGRDVPMFDVWHHDLGIQAILLFGKEPGVVYVPWDAVHRVIAVGYDGLPIVESTPPSSQAQS